MKNERKSKAPKRVAVCHEDSVSSHGELYVDIVMTYISLCTKEVIKNKFFNSSQL